MTEEVNSKESDAPLWGEVILPLALPKVYTYAIPRQFSGKVQPGCRVEVVFGKNKRYAGILKSILKEEPPYPTKAIENILDDEPLLYKHQLELWQWISSYYMCSEG